MRDDDLGEVEPRRVGAVEAPMTTTKQTRVLHGISCVVLAVASLLANGCRNGFAASLPGALVRGERASARVAAPALPASGSPSAAVQPVWQVGGVAIRVVEATAAPDGPGAYRVRVAMDVVGESHPSITLAASRFAIVGEATLAPAVTHVPAVRLGPGDMVRAVLSWQLRTDVRPTEAQLVWNGPDRAVPGAHAVPLAEAPATSVWLRAFRPHPPAERVVVSEFAEVRLGTTDSLVRMTTTVTNRGDEPIELTRDAFHVESEGTAMELVTEATTSTYYGSLTEYCGVTGVWLPERTPVLPGQSVVGTLCFRRPRAQNARLLRVMYGNTDAPSFSATLPVSG